MNITIHGILLLEIISRTVVKSCHKRYFSLSTMFQLHASPPVFQRGAAGFCFRPLRVEPEFPASDYFGDVTQLLSIVSNPAQQTPTQLSILTMTLVRSISLALVFLNGVAAGSLRASSDDAVPVASMSMFRLWAESHSKVYTTEEQFLDRMKVWLGNHGM
jgi:hypothetical protein